MSGAFVSLKVDDPSVLPRLRQKFRHPLKWNDTSSKLNSVAHGAALALVVEIAARAPMRTGAYINSWYVIPEPQRHGATVATPHPAAMRLEYGFVGTDSLGRNYNQAPRPHIRPAVDVVYPEYYAEVRKILDEWKNS